MWDPPARSWGKINICLVTCASQEPRRSVVNPGELLLPPGFTFCLWRLQVCTGCLKNETQGTSLLSGFSWWLSKFCLLLLKSHRRQLFLQRDRVCFLAAAGIAQAPGDTVSPVHWFLCRLLAWWGQIGRTRLERLFIYSCFISLSPCTGDHVRKDLQLPIAVVLAFLPSLP